MRNPVHRLTRTWRKLRWRLAKTRASRNGWFRTIGDCQREIATSDPNPLYLQAYREQEIWYWYRIPKWLEQLGNERFGVERVLDIGGAYGTLALYCRRLFGCEVFVTDYVDWYMSPTLVERNGFHFRVSNIELDPVPWPAKFDLIILTEVLEHLNFDPRPTLMKIRDALSDSGKLMLTTPDAAEWGRVEKYFDSLDAMPEPSPGRPIHDAHIWQYSKEELCRLFAGSGLKIEKFGYAPGKPKRHLNYQLTKM